MMKYPRKFAVCTSCALTGDSSNDFLNCCTRMSVRLFDIPHRKNSTVTSENRTIWPTGNTGCFLSPCDLAPALTDVETCMHYPLEFIFAPQSKIQARGLCPQKVMPVYLSRLAPHAPENFDSNSHPLSQLA